MDRAAVRLLVKQTLYVHTVCICPSSTYPLEYRELIALLHFIPVRLILTIRNNSCWKRLRFQHGFIKGCVMRLMIGFE